MKKIITILVVIVILGAGVFVFTTNKHNEKTFQLSVTTNESGEYVNTDSTDPALAAGKQLSNNHCTGDEKPLLTNAPMRQEDYTLIIPYGLMVGGHVTPIDHQYFNPADYNSGPDAYPVYAMADALLVDISSRASQFGTDEYRLVFSLSCKLFYYYDLVTKLAPDILAEFNAHGHQVEIPITAGQQIGTIGGQTLDFAVWDMDKTLDGFIVPEHYNGESWKIHTVDPLNYYTDELKNTLLAKYIRTQEPRSGKIDYDTDGTLQGSWFREDALGYTDYQGPENYWLTHASFSPDHIDPTGFVISLGDFNGEAKQFAAIGNSPLPKDVTSDTGVVKYSLTQLNYKTPGGSYWDRSSLVTPITFEAGHDPQGCTLVQLTNMRALKLESFPNQSCNSVSGFTDNAKLYER